jgi:hypothetical protein
MPGDVFAVRSRHVFAKAINAVQMFWAKDSHAEYNHTGVIMDQAGNTFEANLRYESGNIYKDYSDVKLKVARPTSEPIVSVNTGLADLLCRYRLKPFYPFWRLPLFIIPPLAKISLFSWDVCSESTAWYLNHCGHRPLPWSGINPDTLADEWRYWRNFEIIFEGVINAAG